jgi:uncharacterized RDD family membrane protein YckC
MSKKVVEFSTDFVSVNPWKRILVRFLDNLVVGSIVGLLVFVAGLFFTGYNISKGYTEISQEYTQALVEKSDGNIFALFNILDFKTNNCESLFEEKQEKIQACEEYLRAVYIQQIILSVITLIVTTSYFVILPLTKMKGQVMKKVFKIQILNAKYQKISVLQSFARESISIIANFIPIIGVFMFLFKFYEVSIVFNLILPSIFFVLTIVDIVFMFVSKDNKSLHDFIADTRVVIESETF